MKITLEEVGRELEEKHGFKDLTVREKLIINATMIVIKESKAKLMLDDVLIVKRN